MAALTMYCIKVIKINLQLSRGCGADDEMVASDAIDFMFLWHLHHRPLMNAGEQTVDQGIFKIVLS